MRCALRGSGASCYFLCLFVIACNALVTLLAVSVVSYELYEWHCINVDTQINTAGCCGWQAPWQRDVIIVITSMVVKWWVVIRHSVHAATCLYHRRYVTVTYLSSSLSWTLLSLLSLSRAVPAAASGSQQWWQYDQDHSLQDCDVTGDYNMLSCLGSSSLSSRGADSRTSARHVNRPSSARHTTTTDTTTHRETTARGPPSRDHTTTSNYNTQHRHDTAAGHVMTQRDHTLTTTDRHTAATTTTTTTTSCVSAETQTQHTVCTSSTQTPRHDDDDDDDDGGHYHCGSAAVADSRCHDNTSSQHVIRLCRQTTSALLNRLTGQCSSSSSSSSK